MDKYLLVAKCDKYLRIAAALRAYLDRLSDRPHEVITTVDDPNFDAKMQAALLQKMRSRSIGKDLFCPSLQTRP